MTTPSGPESAQSNPFTQFYGTLLHQGNMLQDAVRTGLYQKAVFDNLVDFQVRLENPVYHYLNNLVLSPKGKSRFGRGNREWYTSLLCRCSRGKESVCSGS